MYFGMDDGTPWHEWAQVVIGLASIGIAFIAVRIAQRTAQAQAKIQQQATRPYMLVHSIGLVQFNLFEPLRGRAVIVNSGQTPAFNIRTAFRGDLRSVAEPDMVFPAVLREDAAEIFLAPGPKGMQFNSPVAENLQLTQADWDDVTQGRKRLTYLLKIWYQDSMGGDYTTSVRAQLRPETMGLNVTPSLGVSKGGASAT